MCPRQRLRPPVATLLRLHRALRPLVQAIRSRPLLIRALFDVRMPPRSTVNLDSTTLALRRSLKHWGTTATKALDVGTGEAALLSIFLARRARIHVDAVDISQTRVRQSRRVVAYDGADVRIWQSDLFEKVQGRYDLIFSNPPYLPTRVGCAMDLTRRAAFDGDQVWDGGADGTDVIRRILARAPGNLAENGLLLVGVQRFYVPDETMLRIIEESNHTLLRREQGWWTPSVVWVLKPVS